MDTSIIGIIITAAATLGVALIGRSSRKMTKAIEDNTQQSNENGTERLKLEKMQRKRDKLYRKLTFAHANEQYNGGTEEEAKEILSQIKKIDLDYDVAEDMYYSNLENINKKYKKEGVI